MTGEKPPQLGIREGRAVVTQQELERPAAELQREDTDANCRQRSEAPPLELQEPAPIGRASRNQANLVLLSCGSSVYTAWDARVR